MSAESRLVGVTLTALLHLLVLWVLLAEMLRDLLDLSTIEQGRYRVDLEPHGADEIFEDAQALLIPLAEAKRIKLRFSTEPALAVSVDPERLCQVIANLVGNSLKFTQESGCVDMTAQAETSNSAMVRFVVADTGAGMSPDQMTHIFERYWRVRESSCVG